MTTNDPNFETCAQAWAAYRKGMPPECPAIQIIECRRAFMLGMFSMLTMVIDAPDRGTEEEGAAYLQARQEELGAFIALIRAHKA